MRHCGYARRQELARSYTHYVWGYYLAAEPRVQFILGYSESRSDLPRGQLRSLDHVCEHYAEWSLRGRALAAPPAHQTAACSRILTMVPTGMRSTASAAAIIATGWSSDTRRSTSAGGSGAWA